jgi:TRAP-type C4-dicarboxylate transport system substrate-binding protein
MRRIGSLGGAVLAAAVLAVAAPAAAQVATLRVESPIPAAQSTSLSMQIFKDEVVRLSEGTLEVDLLLGSPRGSLKELIDAVHVGSVFATWMSIGNFSRLVPETAVVGMPFVFENHDEARRAIVAGPAGALGRPRRLRPSGSARYRPNPRRPRWRGFRMPACNSIRCRLRRVRRCAGQRPAWSMT